MKTLTRFFLQGLLYLAPISITIYIIVLVFEFGDSLLEDFIVPLLGVRIPGLGLLTIAIIITLTGFLGQTIVAKPLIKMMVRLAERVPILNVIFSAFNDLFAAFVGEEKKFNKPVLVVVNPVTNLEKIGFLTVEDLTFLNEKGKVVVYFPHSYNFSGEMFVVPREQVRPLNLDAADVMKFVVSGGVSGLHMAR